VLATPGFSGRAEGARLLAAAETRCLEIEEEVLASLSDADSPRGILAVARLPRAGAGALPLVPGGVYLFLDGVQEPGNLGAIARAAEAFGCAALACAAGCAHPNHPRALRASAGSLLRLAVAVEAGISEVDERLAPIAPRWVGLTAHGGDSPGAGADARATLLVLGSEGAGISPATEARLDAQWTLPLEAPVESLNVAVAAGVALFALRSARSGGV
jgi:RNA methyltransferase, TrmH family